jgi:hypothetical protein
VGSAQTRRSRVLTEQQAHGIYDVLEQECGAQPDERGAFITSAESIGITEYRFCGALGFGGKVWDDGPWQFDAGRARFRVSCYREDETPERRLAILRANVRLGGVV